MSKHFDFSKFAKDKGPKPTGKTREELKKDLAYYYREVASLKKLIERVKARPVGSGLGQHRSQSDKTMVVNAWIENLESFQQRLDETKKLLAGTSSMG